MKTLTLSLKRKWFDMIKSGEKKEEYRECSEYWIRRFVKDESLGFKGVDDLTDYLAIDVQDCLDSLEFDRLVFTLGYPKADEIARGFKAEGWKEVPEKERENAAYSLGGWIDERDMDAFEPRVGTRYFLIDVRHLTWRCFFRNEA